MIWSELPANLVILGEANLDFMIVKARKTNEKKIKEFDYTEKKLMLFLENREYEQWWGNTQRLSLHLKFMMGNCGFILSA